MCVPPIRMVPAGIRMIPPGVAFLLGNGTVCVYSTGIQRVLQGKVYAPWEVQFQGIVIEHIHYYNRKCMSGSRHYYYCTQGLQK